MPDATKKMLWSAAYVAAGAALTALGDYATSGGFGPYSLIAQAFLTFLAAQVKKLTVG